MKTLNKYITIISIFSLTLQSIVYGANFKDDRYGAANKLARAGIINDHSDNMINYDSDSNILRQEMAAISLGIAKLSKSSSCKNYFTDVQINQLNNWACYSIEPLMNAGIISKSNKKFRPLDNITKAEAVAMLVSAAKIGYTRNTNNSNWQEQVVNFAVSKKLIVNFNDYNELATREFVFLIGANILLLQEGIDLNKNFGDEYNISYSEPYYEIVNLNYLPNSNKLEYVARTEKSISDNNTESKGEENIINNGYYTGTSCLEGEEGYKLVYSLDRSICAFSPGKLYSDSIIIRNTETKDNIDIIKYESGTIDKFVLSDDGNNFAYIAYDYGKSEFNLFYNGKLFHSIKLGDNNIPENSVDIFFKKGVLNTIYYYNTNTKEYGKYSINSGNIILNSADYLSYNENLTYNKYLDFKKQGDSIKSEELQKYKTPHDINIVEYFGHFAVGNGSYIGYNNYYVPINGDIQTLNGYLYGAKSEDGKSIAFIVKDEDLFPKQLYRIVRIDKK